MIRQHKKQGLSEQTLVSYLAQHHLQPVRLTAITELSGTKEGAAALKGFGYGRPIRIRYYAGNAPQEIVLRRVTRNGFGRERPSDRVAEIWRDHHNFNKLPHHVRTLDMVALTQNGRLESASHLRELFLVTEYAPGIPYAEDLAALWQQKEAAAQDRARTLALAAYLADIHSQKHDDPLLWRRRLRDLLGHGEGVMGLADSYTAEDDLSPETLEAYEAAVNRWRWRLKPLTHRLSQVHGDFHPFNILFNEGSDFRVIDRSRGSWGEPADDVSALTINYIFFALQRGDSLHGPFETLFHLFWEQYLSLTGDEDLTAVIAPWFAWRVLVLASPRWYPTISPSTRRQLLAFGRNLMDDSSFDWQHVNRYLVA